MLTKEEEDRQYIRYLEAACDTLEARLARYRRKDQWHRRLWRWLRREGADYKVTWRLRRLDRQIESNKGYFPRKGEK